MCPADECYNCEWSTELYVPQAFAEYVKAWFACKLLAKELEVLGRPDFICNQAGFLMQPVLGLVSAAGFAAVAPSPAEVGEAFTVPLAFFRETAPEQYVYALQPDVPGDFPYETVGIPADYRWARGRVEVPIWYWQGHAVWGMTARLTQDIVRHLE